MYKNFRLPNPSGKILTSGLGSFGLCPTEENQKISVGLIALP
jgi:hypothetical protein